MDNNDSDMYVIVRSVEFCSEVQKEKTKLRSKFYYSMSNQMINLTASFKHLKSTDFLANCQIFFIDKKNQTKSFIGIFPFEDNIFVEFTDWSVSKLSFTYRPIGIPISLDHHKSAIIQRNHKKKSKERTIKEVRESIIKWRQIYQDRLNGDKKPFTLIDAAKEIGISKKSLDDYLRNLRLAEFLKFDFTNQNQKMSVVRNFVRQRASELKYSSPQYVDPDIYWDISGSLERNQISI